MKIKNIEGLSARDLQEEAEKGARFVYYTYTFSLLFVTLRRNSGVYMTRPSDNTFLKAFPFTLTSLFFGWWGVPSGPKHTLESIRANISGGVDVTDEVMATVAGHLLFQEAEARKKAS